MDADLREQMMLRRAGVVAVWAVSMVAMASSAWAANITVSSVDELRQVASSASPGDVITIAPGDYDVSSRIEVTAAGTEPQPITLRAASLGDVTIRMNTLEGFWVNAPNWHFENLDVVGVCADDSDCEHAFHIVGLADGTHISHCRVHDFNAQIKGNGTKDGTNGERVYPDDVVIEHSEFFDADPRQTSNPVTKIDVVGGRRWVVRQNFIHDADKGQGNHISYSAFLKGNSRDGLFEQNLVACEWLHHGDTRLGLSFGGGGTGPDSICEGGTCTPEHQNGVMRNNIIIDCSDVGIYLNESKNTKLYNNTVVNTMGIDARFAATTADIRNNVVTGRIKDRNGGTSTRASNWVGTMSALSPWFPDPRQADFSSATGDALTQLVDAGEALGEVSDDYCGTPRDDGAYDIGAVEYVDGTACDTTTPDHESQAGSGDAGTADAGSTDAGMADTGMADAGTADGGAGMGDTGGSTQADASSDAGAGADATRTSGSGSSSDGCACTSTSGKPAAPGVLAWLFAAVGLAGALRRRWV